PEDNGRNPQATGAPEQHHGVGSSEAGTIDGSPTSGRPWSDSTRQAIPTTRSLGRTSLEIRSPTAPSEGDELHLRFAGSPTVEESPPEVRQPGRTRKLGIGDATRKPPSARRPGPHPSAPGELSQPTVPDHFRDRMYRSRASPS